MTINAKYNIGDIVHLFGFGDWKCVVTGIMVRASGQIEYHREWNNDGEPKCDWYEEKQLELLEKISQ